MVAEYVSVEDFLYLKAIFRHHLWWNKWHLWKVLLELLYMVSSSWEPIHKNIILDWRLSQVFKAIFKLRKNFTYHLNSITLPEICKLLSQSSFELLFYYSLLPGFLLILPVMSLISEIVPHMTCFILWYLSKESIFIKDSIIKINCMTFIIFYRHVHRGRIIWFSTETRSSYIYGWFLSYRSLSF